MTINNVLNTKANMSIDLNFQTREFAGFQLCHDYKQVTRSNFDKCWNLFTTASFHSWSIVCSYAKS